jgi:uncharacterized membrane protein
MSAQLAQAPHVEHFYTGRLVTPATLCWLPHDHGSSVPGVKFTMQVGRYGHVDVEVPFAEGADAAARAFAQGLHVGDPFTARVYIRHVHLCLHKVPARNYTGDPAAPAPGDLTPASAQAPAEADLFS